MGKDYEKAIDFSDTESANAKMIEMVGGDKRVIDFGCSTGYMSRKLKEHGCYVLGIEIDPDAAEKASDICDRVIVADLDRIDLAEELEDERFDVGLFGDVIEHLKYPGRVLSGVREVLAPGGYVVVSVPNIAHASIRLKLLSGDFDYEDMGILDDTHLKYFTRKSIGDLLESCGYTVESMDWVNRPVSEEQIKRKLDPLGMNRLDEVLILLSSWEAVAFQYIVKAFPATEEERVKKLSEDKVQAERRVAELEVKLEDHHKLEEDIKRLESSNEHLARDLAEKAQYSEKLEEEVRAGNRDLVDQIEKKNKYISDLESEVANLQGQIAAKNEVISQAEERIRELQGKLEEREALLTKKQRMRLSRSE